MSKAAQLSQSYSSPRVFADISAIAASRPALGRVLELVSGARYETGSTDLGAGILLANGLYANILPDASVISSFTTSALIGGVISGISTGDVINTTGFVSSGDGGGGGWVVTGNIIAVSQSPSQTGLGTCSDSAGNEFSLRDYPLNIVALGAVGDGVTDSSLPILAGTAQVKADGGGELFIPAGVFISPVFIADFDGMTLNGVGVSSRMKLVTGANNNFINTTELSGFTLSNLTIDQNRANQTTGHAFRSSNSNNIRIFNVDVVEAKGYGLGFQGEGTHKDIYIDRVNISNVENDGIDFKNRNDDNKNIFISNVNVSSFGIGVSDKAGIDIRGPANLSNVNIDVTQGTTPTALRFRSGEAGDSNGVGGHKSTLNNFQITGSDIAGSLGINVGGRKVKISNGNITGQAFGLRTEAADTKITNVDCEQNSTGFDIGDSRAKLVNCNANDNTSRGFDIDGDDTRLISCDAIDNTVHGIRTQAAAGNTVIYGGAVSGNTPNIGDSGTGTIIKDVTGYATESYTETADLAVDSTGSKSFSVAHGLVGTPDLKDVILTIQRVTAVADYSVDFIRVNTTTSTNVTGEMFVGSASATGSAVAKLNIHTKLKHQ